MGYRLIIDHFDDGSFRTLRLKEPVAFNTIMLEVGIDAYYDMEDEWQHPLPESLLDERIKHYER